jgi:signal transduction histidine kinase
VRVMGSNPKFAKLLNISRGGHILYFFEDSAAYIDNVIEYITTGIQRGYPLMLIDHVKNHMTVKNILRTCVSEKEIEKIHFVDQSLFSFRKDFDCLEIASNFEQVAVGPTLQSNAPFRVWAHIDRAGKEGVFHHLEEFETTNDARVKGLGMMSVCAYDASLISASQQISMMRLHSYFMTDKELTRSPLYTSNAGTISFPSLSVYSDMQSEIDFHKQKLDFAHVVSDEVRNPLTVIQANVYMLKELENHLSVQGIEKIKMIEDYVKLIDNELSHIIHTEEMLFNDLSWSKEPVYALPIFQEVVDVMAVKARTQGRELAADMYLEGTEQLYSNAVGLKLLLTNLIDNSITYSFDASQITVVAYAFDAHVIVTIQDQGDGLSLLQIQSLFENMQRQNSSKNMRGMGLYMVKNLLDHFQGQLDIQSRENIGTLVSVTLPMIG